MRAKSKFFLIAVAFLVVVGASRLVQTTRERQNLINVPVVIPSHTPITSTFSNNRALPTATLTPSVQAEEQSVNEKLLSLYNHPIVFYGKVVDLNKNPISGVLVSFVVHDSSPTGTTEIQLTSDANGNFTLENSKGRSTIVRLTKAGYHERTDLNKIGFDYVFEQRSDYYLPDPINPVIFYMQQELPQEVIVHKTGSYKFANDGTPVGVDLISGRIVPIADSDVTVVYWKDSPSNTINEYGWHCTLSTSAGGFVERKNAFDFVAPDAGYAPQYTVQTRLGGDNYSKSAEANLFIMTRSSPIYGRMRIKIVTAGDHFFYLDYYVNPSGSHNLESK